MWWVYNVYYVKKTILKQDTDICGGCIMYIM